MCGLHLAGIVVALLGLAGYGLATMPEHAQRIIGLAALFLGGVLVLVEMDSRQPGDGEADDEQADGCGDHVDHRQHQDDREDADDERDDKPD